MTISVVTATVARDRVADRGAGLCAMSQLAQLVRAGVARGKLDPHAHGERAGRHPVADAQDARLSDSLTTVTSSFVSSIPARAASIATMVASHDASAARISQPGDGPEAPPPSDFAMSVGELAERPLDPAAEPVHVHRGRRRVQLGRRAGVLVELAGGV